MQTEKDLEVGNFDGVQDIQIFVSEFPAREGEETLAGKSHLTQAIGQAAIQEN